jgi:hypothetical protein
MLVCRNCIIQNETERKPWKKFTMLTGYCINDPEVPCEICGGKYDLACVITQEEERELKKKAVSLKVSRIIRDPVFA